MWAAFNAAVVQRVSGVQISPGGLTYGLTCEGRQIALIKYTLQISGTEPEYQPQYFSQISACLYKPGLEKYRSVLQLKGTLGNIRQN